MCIHYLPSCAAVLGGGEKRIEILKKTVRERPECQPSDPGQEVPRSVLYSTVPRCFRALQAASEVCALLPWLLTVLNEGICPRASVLANANASNTGLFHQWLLYTLLDTDMNGESYY